MSERGSFESDVHVALKKWLKLGLWDTLNSDTLSSFKRKISKVCKKRWPQGLEVDGNLAWLHHNHIVFSGNVPLWADWEWPKGKDMGVYQSDSYYLLIGKHHAGGSEACCLRLLCGNRNKGLVYQHYFFDCGG